MKSRLRQYEILLLRLAEQFGEVVPFEDLSVALGYLPEERDPLKAQACIARTYLPDTVELFAVKGFGYRLAKSVTLPETRARTRTARCAYCGEPFMNVITDGVRLFRYCCKHRTSTFRQRVINRRRALAVRAGRAR